MTIPDIETIIAWEQGALEPRGELELFADLIKSGIVWGLQGVYGRTAHDYIQAGLITPEGEINEDVWSALND